MAIGWTQIVIIAVLLVLLFGRGKISDLMGDVAKGIRSFKSGLAEDDAPVAGQPQSSINHEGGAQTVDTQAVKQDETNKS